MSIDKPKNKQVLLTLPIDLLDDIEDYWHKNKLKSRNAGILELIKKGLSTQEKDSPRK